MNIGASVAIKGTIAAGEDFSVAGRVEGEIHLSAGTLMLAPGSSVIGDASAPSVVVAGNVDGNLVATDRVDVRPGASVAGSISAPSLLVADGAELNCRIQMPKTAPSQASSQPAPVAALPSAPKVGAAV
jgi:cytoskeletal protein CcmA (bactofilin family)